MGRQIQKAALLTKDNQCMGAAKLVVFCNAVEDNPFMAGAFHGVGEADSVLSVGVSGPGVVRSVLHDLPDDAPLNEVAETIKKTAFKITRVGQLVGSEAAAALGVPFGIVDLSLAPTPQSAIPLHVFWKKSAWSSAVLTVHRCTGHAQRCG